MKITVTSGALAEQKADALIVSLLEGAAELTGAAHTLNQTLNGALQELITNGDFTGKLNATAVVYTRGLIASPRVILVGLGKAEKFSTDKVRLASATATQKARDLGAKRVASVAHGDSLEPSRAAQATVEGALLGAYEYQKNGTQPGKQLDELSLVEAEPARLAAVQTGAQAGQHIAESTNFARDLVNQPPNICIPEYMASKAREIAQEVGLTCKIMEPAEMQELGMGALLAVGAASDIPARFIILEHRPAGTDNMAPVVLVGKGITFDSGGLSIKPADSMPEMKSDMGGGAAVLGAMRAVGALKLPLPIIGLVPTTENVIGSTGFRPADVLRASNGKTIEIISTDAEGRLILADALVYAGRYKPAAVIDLATLTGACIVALGSDMAAGLFGSDDALMAKLRAASDRTGERIWPLPLYEEYRERINSDVADLKNSGGDRFAGIGISAAFLQEFAEGYPWAHLDIAPMAYLSRPKTPWAKGGTGFGVRLLVELLQSWKN